MDGTAINPVETEPRVITIGPREKLLLVAAIVCLAALLGYRAGTHRSSVRWHTGKASAVEAQIGGEADGRSYSIPLDGFWQDANGSFHDRGRPDCLPPSNEVVAVRFAEVAVKIDGSTWHKVVFVKC